MDIDTFYCLLRVQNAGIGLKINAKKTKSLRLGIIEDKKVILGNENIDQVDCFTYIINNLASRGIRTYFQYVPSHSDIIDDHEADKIGKILLILTRKVGDQFPIETSTTGDY